MPMNRIQFQPGLSMAAFLKIFGTERTCQAALKRARWPKGFECPACAGRDHSVFERNGVRLWQCSACRHQTSLTAGTVFDSTKLPLRTWFLAIFLLSQSKNNIAALELKRQFGVCYRTAWLVKHKLMQAMAQREQGRLLGEVVQIASAGSAPAASAGAARKTRSPSWPLSRPMTVAPCTCAST